MILYCFVPFQVLGLPLQAKAERDEWFIPLPQIHDIPSVRLYSAQRAR